MHPGAGNRDETLVNALVHRFGEQVVFLSSGRPGIVHRLDKDTSGVVVVARDVETLNALSAQFAARTVGRAYKALVFSTPRAQRQINLSDRGKVDAAIGRHPTKRTSMAVVKEGGKRAVTNWGVVERMPYGTLIVARLETGRTHQIRVHMNHIHSPVIGDLTYGDFSGLPHELRMNAQRFGRQALHAYRIEFEHPVTKERLSFESPLPEDFRKLIDEFRAWKGA
jgi:23S rRNA pseudouridine1911/1915/1917 synthase